MGPRLRIELTDEALMLRFQRGDVNAFADLLHRHKTPLFNFVLRSVRSHATADDLLQETFLRVVQNAQDFKHDARFCTWLYTIARNLCVDHHRKAALRHTSPLDSPVDNHPSASAEHAALSSELRSRIADAVESLPDDQREVFLLREVANLGFKEIALVTETSENTVKSRMRYALEKLQEALVDLSDNDPFPS